MNLLQKNTVNQKSATNEPMSAYNLKKSAQYNIPLTKIIVCILILMLTLQLVTALGIRPAKTTINSEEIKVYKGTIWVVNNDHQELTIALGPGGEFGQYITLSAKELTFREDIDALPVDFEINLPTEIPPGGASANIIIEEKPQQTENGGEVGAKISLKHKITIENGYPDKYIEPKLNFHESGDNIRLVSEVQNLGKKEVNKIKTKFYINNRLQNNKEKIETRETEETNLKAKEGKLLEANIPRSLFTAGEFEVTAITTYDEQQIEMSKKLTIGKPEIDITYFNKYFKANEINKYSLDLLNNWNKEIENVFVDIIVKKENNQIDQFRTKSLNIDAHTTQQINDYFDARNKNPGTYTFDMVVNFWNSYKMETKTFQSDLLSPDDEQKITPNQPTTNKITGKAAGQTEEQEKQNTNKSGQDVLVWIILAISSILLITGAYLIYKSRTRSSQNQEEQEF